MDYKVVKAESQEDKARIEHFINDFFFPDNPLTNIFGLEELPPPPPSPRPPKADGDFTFMAVDAQGNIVGVAINKASVDHDFGTEVHPKVKKLIEFMDWVEVEARLDTLPEKTIELRVLAVHREWRRRGVARRLAEESVRQAREAGHQAIRTCCTSEYTARLARSLGWRQHYCLRYLEYPGDVQLTPQQTHECIYYYVTDL
ncbi:uncharacterized protein LOC128994501 isoform X2 [Macrosteles quadrilineatus]|uniref:uncharacterized protein LOC128994501 isoform X2 n=1 Tax=Macrosteles quadrilineatus TaxID=74068 RepID=UPI0023E253AD|nr:uncharacterized protein LOC128994501 isoform X2 [Macrosteles quadrilineatus]XP_054275072.1 uncharacterized protein LOC128994501 isoform X2 [Macrosteles quadrilineatus]